MSAARDLTGLVGPGESRPPERTVTTPPPRRRSSPDTPPDSATSKRSAAPVDDPEKRSTRRQRRKPFENPSVDARGDAGSRPERPRTVRISVNIPLACRRWLAGQARDQQRFVSEIVMEALDRYGADACPPAGRAKRAAVPDGTICNIVLPAQDRQRIDEVVARKNTTRSALLTDVLSRAGNE
jgi:hypothetical protein